MMSPVALNRNETREWLVLLAGVATLVVGLVKLDPGVIGAGAGLMTFVAATRKDNNP